MTIYVLSKLRDVLQLTFELYLVNRVIVQLGNKLDIVSDLEPVTVREIYWLIVSFPMFTQNKNDL